MWKVKLWDGTRLEQAFTTMTEAVDAAKESLRDWMEPDDSFYVHHMPSDDFAYVWVLDSTGECTDADAKVFFRSF